MHRFVLTGAPGSGKTAILRQLELDGFGVVEEAATDVIALAQARGVDEPWQRAGFTETIADLQHRRQLGSDAYGGGVIAFDRSPVCTYALALFLGHPVGPILAAELDRIRAEKTYQRRVFFIAGQGSIAPTAARRISLPDAQRFERLHTEVYRALGYELVVVEAGPVGTRAAQVRSEVSAAR